MGTQFVSSNTFSIVKGHLIETLYFSNTEGFFVIKQIKIRMDACIQTLQSFDIVVI